MLNEMTLSLNGDTFEALKADFDTILNNTLRNMDRKGADTAEISIKLKVSLDKDEVPDFNSVVEGDTRPIIKPSFEHNIQSVMTIKDKKAGILSGEYELVWDPTDMKFKMKKIDNGQTSLFDEEPDGRPIDVEYTDVTEYTEDASVDPDALPPAMTGALPEHIEEIVDADE